MSNAPYTIPGKNGKPLPLFHVCACIKNKYTGNVVQRFCTETHANSADVVCGRVSKSFEEQSGMTDDHVLVFNHIVNVPANGKTFIKMRKRKDKE